MEHTVKIASPLRSYVHGATQVRAQGDSLQELLADLEHAYPGMRFRMIDEQERIRPHIRIFVNSVEALTLDFALLKEDVIHLICALSGG